MASKTITMETFKKSNVINILFKDIYFLIYKKACFGGVMEESYA